MRDVTGSHPHGHLTAADVWHLSILGNLAWCEGCDITDKIYRYTSDYPALCNAESSSAQSNIRDGFSKGSGSDELLFEKNDQKDFSDEEGVTRVPTEGTESHGDADENAFPDSAFRPTDEDVADTVKATVSCSAPVEKGALTSSDASDGEGGAPIVLQKNSSVDIFNEKEPTRTVTRETASDGHKYENAFSPHEYVPAKVKKMVSYGAGVEKDAFPFTFPHTRALTAGDAFGNPGETHSRRPSFDYSETLTGGTINYNSFRRRCSKQSSQTTGVCASLHLSQESATSCSYFNRTRLMRGNTSEIPCRSKRRSFSMADGLTGDESSRWSRRSSWGPLMGPSRMPSVLPPTNYNCSNASNVSESEGEDLTAMMEAQFGASTLKIEPYDIKLQMRRAEKELLELKHQQRQIGSELARQGSQVSGVSSSVNQGSQVSSSSSAVRTHCARRSAILDEMARSKHTHLDNLRHMYQLALAQAKSDI